LCRGKEVEGRGRRRIREVDSDTGYDVISRARVTAVYQDTTNLHKRIIGGARELGVYVVWPLQFYGDVLVAWRVGFDTSNDGESREVLDEDYRGTLA